MRHLCIQIETACPGCGQLCRSIGQVEVVGWECPMCGYYDARFNWLSSNILEVYQSNIDFEEIEFDMEVEKIVYGIQSQNH